MKKRIKWEYNKLITNLLIVLTIFLGFKCLYEANYYRLLICLIAIPVIILPKIFKKKINFPDELEWFYLIFIFFSLTLGSIINLYDIVL